MNYHDQKLDTVDGIAGGMKEDGRLISDELRLHNNMLENLNEDVDEANAQMHRVDTKLKKLLNNTNT